MSRVISPDKWVKYTTLRDQGYSIRESAKRAGFSESAAHRFEAGSPTSTGIRVKAVVEAATLPKVKTGKQLKAEAAHCIECFPCFRLRYFGRTSTPWQVDAAQKMVELRASPYREYVVVNVPPGSGKSTLFTHDLLAWFAVRDRNIRCMIGSITESLVRDYTRRLRNTFERTVPDMATSREISQGLRGDAEATLQGDYGRFKPERQDRWQERSFVIATERDQAGSDKEVSFAGFGADSKFIGGRYDVIVWDDLEDLKNIPTAEQREQKEKWFEDVSEARLEPGGLFILQGQRLHADDIYRWALNQKDLLFDENNELLEDQTEAPSRYKHIIYKAHYDEMCSEGSHRLDAPAWDGTPEGGCLLDPKRLSWRFLAPKKAQNPGSFAVVYQQEDVNPAKVLVQKEWIEGGKDSNGEYHPGCKDQDRGLNIVPKGLAGQLLHIVTADPSPTRYWSIQSWVFAQESKYRYLLDHLNQAMDAPDFLGYNLQTRTFYGVLEDWWQRSAEIGYPIQFVIVEEAAAQRYLLQYDHVKEWQRQRRVRIIGHATHRNKADAKFGVQSLGPVYRDGLVRLPWGDEAGRQASMKLIKEVTRWHVGSSSRDDCHPAGVIIQTARGPVPVESVRVGDAVLTHTGNWKPVEAVGTRPEREQMFTLRTAGVMPLQVTGNHPVFVVPGYRERPTNRERYDVDAAEFIPAEKLTGSRRHSENPQALLTPFSTAVTDPTLMDTDDQEFALLLGVYLAEGSVSDHAVHFSLNAQERVLADWLIRVMRRRYGCNHNEVVINGGLALVFQSVRARADFDKYGRKTTKALPVEALTWPATLQRAVLRGWMIGDGCYSRNVFRATSISRPLITQMETFAARNGAPTRLAVHQHPRSGMIDGRPYTSRIQWALTLGQAALARVLDPACPLDADRWGAPTLRPGRNVGMQVDTERGFVLRKLRAVDVAPYDGDVFSLQVADDRSYVAESVAVHNCVMAQWFLEWQLGTNALFKPTSSEAPRRANIPKWIGRTA